MPFDMEALKRVPKPVWIIGGGLIVGFVILTRKGGSGAAILPSTVGGGGGGDGQGVLTGEDLTAFLADQQQQQADFLASLGDAINGGTGTGGGSGSIPGHLPAQRPGGTLPPQVPRTGPLAALPGMSQADILTALTATNRRVAALPKAPPPAPVAPIASNAARTTILRPTTTTLPKPASAPRPPQPTLTRR